MKIAVLGAGPAGLMAVHACHLAGHTDVSVHSIKNKSPLGGAQYLHSAIPELTTEEPTVVRYVKVGTREGYAEKVYGNPTAPCSWDRFDGEADAWNLRSQYQELWDRYDHLIVDGEVRHPLVEELCEENDLVFSTITPLGYCVNQDAHNFQWEEIYACMNTPEETPDNTIVYNGLEDDGWYRASVLFGTPGSEWPVKAKGIPGRRMRLRKPLSTNCDCIECDYENFIKIGRYGLFDKELLVDDAFADTVVELNAV